MKHRERKGGNNFHRGDKMTRVYNFSAGPACLPEWVLTKAANEMLDAHNSGMSVMEMSHRSSEFKDIIDTCKARLKRLMNIPDEYEILFLQGGASLQFTMVPLNLEKHNVDLINTGQWTKKALKEHEKLGKVNVVASSAEDNFTYIPKIKQEDLSEDSDYVYICENNTIYGTKYKELPPHEGKLLVADLSSCILSERTDVSKYDLIFAGAQKNMGPAGLTVVIIKKDLIGLADEKTPSMLNYKTYADNDSMFNTPPTYAIYICGLVLEWLETQIGGLENMEKINREKAKLLYDYIDASKLYSNPERKELSMVFQFEHIGLDQIEGKEKWDVKSLELLDLKKVLSKWQTELEGHGWNSLFWNNHDLPRIVSRWGNDGDYRVLSAKMLATLLHGMKGTPYIYQGEEIGMTNVPFQTIDEFPDIETQNIYQERLKAGFTEEETMYAIRAKARDNARTPMQWNAEKNAGFTEGIPWYRVNPNYKEINVEQALADPESVFYHYQKLIQLRKEHEVMVYGTYQLLFPEDEDLYIYTRTLEEEKWLIVCNFHEKTRKLQCKRAGQVMLSNYADTPAAEKITELRPYEAVIYQMESWDANHGERGQDHSSDFEADIELV